MAVTVDPRRRPLVVGVNHKSAALGLRDRLFVEDNRLPKVLKRLRDVGLSQAVFLSTCDRVEVQAAVVNVSEAVEAVRGVMAANADLSVDQLEGSLYIHSGEDAARHMFAVAASLDSLVIGEPQVLGQVKAAIKTARENGLMGPDLDRCLQAALRAAKAIRAKTRIGEKPVSISAAACRVAVDIHGHLGNARGLIVGAGDMAELIASDMIKAGLGELTVIHPRRGLALATAKVLDCHIADFSRLAGLMAEADIVMTSLGGRERLLNADMVLAALKARRYKPAYLLDLAVPGDIDPAVNRIDEAFLYDLSELEQVAMDGIALRENESTRAWAILEEQLGVFRRGHAERSAVPVVQDLRRLFEIARDSALAESGDDAEKATRLVINRLLHRPTSVLRALAGETGATACSVAEWDLTEQVLRRLFDLSPDAVDSAKREDENNGS